jgi:hypothetical protein
MPKIKGPKRKSLLVRLTTEERERLEVVQLYFNRATMAGAIRDSIRLAHKAIRGAKVLDDSGEPLLE